MENSANEGTQYTLNDISKLSKLSDNEISEEEITQLVELCQVARDNSYSPYSKFRVGCCLLTDDGKFIKGTNVENVSYGATICAERSAICSGVSNGHTKFKAAMVTTDMDYFISPCGICRQALKEFNVKYCYLLDKNLNIQFFTVNYLLPSGCEIPHLKN